MNLGTRVDPHVVESAPSNIGRWDGKVNYPSVAFHDKACEKFCAKPKHDFDIKDEFTATVKFRVTGLVNNQYGRSITFDVLSINNVRPTENMGDDLRSVMSDDEPD